MPEVAPIAVVTHLVVGNPSTQGLSQLLVTRTTNVLAAFAEGVNILFNGPDCGCCSTFTWLRKLSNTTSGSTLSSSSFCRQASIRMRFLHVLVRNTGWEYHSQQRSPPDVSSQPISQEAQMCCRPYQHQISVSCPNRHSHVDPTTTEPKLKLELEQGTGRVTPSV